MSWMTEPKNKKLVEKILKRGRRRVPLKDPAVSPRSVPAPKKPEKQADADQQHDFDYSELGDWALPPEGDMDGMGEAVSTDGLYVTAGVYQCTTCSSIGDHRGVCSCCGSGSLVIVEPDHPA